MNKTVRKIAYLGPPGTYSEQAAKQWNNVDELLPVESIPAVAKSVEEGESYQGVVPIENSIEGGVTFTLDLLIHDSTLSICGEVIVPINHYLMAQKEIDLENITTVFSHPQSLGQCRQFLLNNIPQATLMASLSNAKAVEEMLDSTPNSAAISSERSANLYGAVVLQKNVEDNPNNETRFVILSQDDHEITSNDKTSLCFEFDGDSPGILSESLTEFAARNINLVKIESRPNKRRLGRYVFLVDIDGHRRTVEVKQALDSLQKKVSMLKIFGSYPKGDV
ncbi:MAG TPA: prephenate dehydratase [SAR202 cluster bacterium]|nr:prephenate dehydratase [SAR202 cluster bacterium]